MFLKAVRYLGILLFLLAPLVVLAQWQVPNAGETGLSNTDVPTILKTFITWALGVAGLLGIIAFIIGGFWYLTAAGDTNRIELGKRTVWWAIVGIAVSILGLVAITAIDMIISGGGGGTTAPAGSDGIIIDPIDLPSM